MGFVCDSLVPHPARMPPPVRAFAAAASWAAGRPLALCFRLEAPLENLTLPAGSGGRADGLWEHTCFEAFVAPVGAARYLEINLAPSGAWAAYAFSSYRKPARPKNAAVTVDLDVRFEEGVVELEALVGIDSWLRSPPDELAVGLAAVLEDASGNHTYWALEHGGAQPDFHDDRSFVLHLVR